MTSAANAGLRRRLALRAASAIEVARALGDWQRVEELTAAELDRRAAAAARDGAAAVAALPLSERMGRGS